MPRKFSREFINQVLLSRPIEYWASKYLKLNKKGKDAFCICPFHHENTPSFSINLVKGFYYCFGCQESGNAIDLYMHFEKASFAEAIEGMAEDAGIAIEKSDDPNQQHLDTLKKVSRAFEQSLRESQAAISYLKSRGLSGQVAKDFALGYSVQNIREFCRLSGFGVKRLVDAGLVLSSQRDGQPYPRFRQRIMFPIHNVTGQVVGFGGRILANGEPKYLNSAEAAWFDKSRILYGLFQARQKRVETMYIVEGYLDVIGLYQHGIYGAVAPMGTSITANHLRLLCRYCKDIVICFDGDKPGQLAMRKAFEKVLSILNDGVKIRFISLPAEHDPDSYVATFGQEKWLAMVDNAMTIDGYIESQFLNMAVDWQSRVQVAIELKPLIEQMANSITKHALAQFIGDRLELGQDWMSTDLPKEPQAEKKEVNKPLSATDKLWDLLLSQAGPELSGLSLWQELMKVVPDEKTELVKHLSSGKSLGELMELNRGDDAFLRVNKQISKTNQNHDDDLEFAKSILIKLTIQYIEHNINRLIYRLKQHDGDTQLRKELNEALQKKNELQKLARVKFE